MPAGAPTTFDLEKALKIMQLHADGMTMTKACKQIGVPFSTFWEWERREENKISDAYARARKEHNRRIVDELQEITALGSDYVSVDDHGRTDVNHAKLRGEFHRQYLYLLDRQTYGASDETALGVDISNCKTAAETLALLTKNAGKLGSVQAQTLMKVAEMQQKTEELAAMTKRVEELEKKLSEQK